MLRIGSIDSKKLGLNSCEQFMLFFWEPKQPEEADVEAFRRDWRRVRSNLLRVKKTMTGEGVEPATVSSLDRDGYLAAIRAIFTEANELVIVPGDPPGLPAGEGALKFYNDRLCSMYARHVEWWGNGGELPHQQATEWGMNVYEALDDQERKQAWDGWDKLQRRAHALYLKNLLPGVEPSFRDSLLEGVVDDWITHERYDCIKEVVRLQIRFEHRDFWDSSLDERFGFWPEGAHERLDLLAYHAAFAAYFNKPQIVEKLLALMRFVAMAPGAPSERHSTWVAYVRP